MTKDMPFDTGHWDVLDQGFVRLVDWMGDDAAVVQAARVSYGEGTTNVNDDRGLIRYLMRHWHTTPFEMVEFKFHLKMPIFVARQWIRHRTASINEESGRYSVLKSEFYWPDAWRTQSKSNKQGSEGLVDEATSRMIFEDLDSLYRGSAEFYEAMITEEDEGGPDVARELARIALPLSTYTEFYWKIDLHNLLHFLRLRLDSHAQQEIREVADPLAEVVQEICPHSWEAFEDYRLNAVTLSAMEWERIVALVYQSCDDYKAGPRDVIPPDMTGKMSKREHREFLARFEV